MSQSEPPSFTFQAPPGWDALKSTTSRRRTDGPILPVDLMSIIIQDLTKDRSLGTLASLQLTSREMYNMATPALYQHIIVDQRQAVKLFRLFESFPRSDNTIFLHPALPDPSAHLIDVHIAERLRFFFSNTQSLSLKTTRRSGRPDDPDTEERLARYKELQIGLLTFNRPTLWPKLEQCAWFPRPWPAHPHNGTSLNTEEDEVFLKSIFAGFHPNQLVIQIPEFSLPFNPLYYDLSSCAKHLRADHIEIFDYTIGTRGSLPRASKSMTIRFRKWSLVETDDWDLYDLYDVYHESIDSLFQTVDRFVDIRELTLVGVLSTTMAHPLVTDPSTQTQVLDDMARDVHDEVMTFRLQHRNLNDLKVTLQSDFSPEGEAAAVSRVFKQPERS